MPRILNFLFIAALYLGVESVVTNVDEKSVVVTAEGVTAADLVAKLDKWSKASGKYVKAV